MKTINIAVAGHTNTGKTTLIRTLMKTDIGDVGDSPNVTKRGQAYYFDGLQATFIDTPGFQHPLAIRMYLDLLNENPNLKHSQDLTSKLSYDHDALKALENSDVVIYVASLSVVPDDSYKEEISVIKRKSSKIVAVINQYKKQLESTSKEAVQNRIKQWTDVFKEQSIDKIITFDAHWDNPKKVNQLYDNILQILDDDQKSRFVEGLKRFKERQADIRKEACEMLASLIEEIREIELTNISKKDFENHNKQNDAKEKVLRKINGSIAEFVYCVSELYKIAAQEPTTSKEQLLLKMEEKVNFRNRMGDGSAAAAILGAISACFGSILGAAVMGVLTGGTGIISGATAGAQFGAFIGTTIGSLAVFSDDHDTVAIKIEIEQIRTLFVTGIAIIWGLSSNGYGRASKLSSVESQQIEQQIKQHIDRVQSQCREIDLLHVNKIAIIRYCEKLLESLENEIE